MTACPYCAHENLPGMDVCDQCGHSLTDLYLPEPASDVERGLLTDRVEALAPRPPIAVAPETPTADVLRLMVDRRIGCVLVVQDDRLLGIFSERDALLKLNIDAARLGDRPVADFMTTPVDTLDGDAKIAFAVHRMDLGSFRHVPVVDEAGKPTGIISARDILRHLAARL